MFYAYYYSLRGALDVVVAEQRRISSRTYPLARLTHKYAQRTTGKALNHSQPPLRIESECGILTQG